MGLNEFIANIFLQKYFAIFYLPKYFANIFLQPDDFATWVSHPNGTIKISLAKICIPFQT